MAQFVTQTVFVVVTGLVAGESHLCNQSNKQGVCFSHLG